MIIEEDDDEPLEIRLDTTSLASWPLYLMLVTIHLLVFWMVTERA